MIICCSSVMLITEFLDLHGIKWRPAKVIPKGDSTLEGDFIFIDTSVVYQLDIDEPCPLMDQLIASFPYYESVCKKLPHVFCHFEAPGEYGKLTAAKIDYLKGLMTYARRDAQVFNSDKPIGNIKFENNIE